MLSFIFLVVPEAFGPIVVTIFTGDSDTFLFLAEMILFYGT